MYVVNAKRLCAVLCVLNRIQSFALISVRHCETQSPLNGMFEYMRHGDCMRTCALVCGAVSE